MPSLIKRGCLLLLAVPALACARPVTVVTHSTGTASVNPAVLGALGQQDMPAADDIPYELTLTSTFDWNGPLPARGEGTPMYEDTQVVVDLHMADITYHYANEDWSTADLYTPSFMDGDSYGHKVWAFPAPYVYGYHFNFEHVFRGPAGSMGPGGPLTPGAFASGDNPDGSMRITAIYSNDEYTFLWTMWGKVDSYSVTITSPVPEPASYGLLAAGLLTLGLRRRGA